LSWRINILKEKFNTMPVLINEIIIRAIVDPKPEATNAEGGLNCPPSGNTGMDPEMAEKILEIIREKNER
jgi:hypothetical protein